MNEESPEIRPLRDADWAAAVLGLSKPRIYDLVRQRILPHVRLGRQVRFDERAIAKFVESGGSSLPEEESEVVPLLTRRPHRS